MRTKVLTWIASNKEKGWVLTDQALVSGTNFFVGILLARFLGVELFGLFSLAWMVLFFSAGIQQAFLTAPLFALTARQEDRSTWLGQLFFVQILFSIGTFFTVFAIAEITYYFKPSWNQAGVSIVMASLVAVYLFNDFTRRTLFVDHQPQKVISIDLFGYALQPVFICMLYFLDALTLYTALASILTAQFIALIYILIKIPFKIIRKGAGKTTVRLWKYSRFLLATALLQWSSANYIVLFAASILGPAAIGAIRVSQNLMGILNVLFLAMENLIPARSAEAFYQGGLLELGIYMRKITLQLAAPVLLFIAGIALFHEQIIAAIYGEAYLPYSYILLAFCGIYILVFLGTLLRFIIRTLEYNQLIFWSYVLTTVFSLIIGKLLAVNFGLSGVMIGIAGTQIISFISFIIFLKIKVKWNFRLFTSS